MTHVKKFYPQDHKKPQKFQVPEKDPSDFSDVDTATICQSIMLLVNELGSRNMKIFDWDNKRRSLKDIKFFGTKIFFYATED